MKTMRQRGLVFRIVVLVMVLSLFPLSFPASADDITESSPVELEERDESTVRATTRYEVEANNTMATANRIYNDDTTYGKIGYSGDVDWFKIMFTFSGQANFWLGDIPSGKDYDLYLYNASGTVIASSTTNNSSLPQEYIGHFTVSANTWYYIKVVGYNCYDASANYQLRVREVEQFEAEANNTMATANQINDNETIYGKIAYSGDVDYYKVQFNFTGKANFWLGDIPSGKDFNLYLYNASGGLLASSTSNNSSLPQEFIGSYSVTANAWYYIKVVGANCYDTTNYYQLRTRYYSPKELKIIYDSTCNESVASINSAVAEATEEFAAKFAIEFNTIYTGYSSELQGANCPNTTYTKICNANCGNTTMCKQTHHKGPGLLEIADSSTVYTYRLVGHMVCNYNADEGLHRSVVGFGNCPGKDSLTSTYYTSNLARSIQHELTHNLGANHNCVEDQECVLQGDINQWCDNCIAAINQNR